MVAFVLIVDDNTTDRTGMARLLQSAGLRVVTSNDGREALHVVESERPGLILLDMVMPSGFDGWFFLGQRKHYAAADIPVLIVTGLPMASDSWASELGVQGFLKKPLDADTLLEEVRRLMER